MKYNERELALMSERKSDMEGRLNYKKINLNNYYYQSVFKERWFKLLDNFLFYFRINEFGKIDVKQPAGVFVLENASIELEQSAETPFAFSISYEDGFEKKHILSGMSEANVTLWITRLRQASYENLRNQLYFLQSKIYARTGKDPLLMVPRNEGSKGWAPGDPVPSEHRIVYTTSFRSHVTSERSSSHVARSKSNVNVMEDTHVTKKEVITNNLWPGHSGLERSKTSVHVVSKKQTFDSSIFNQESSSSWFNGQYAPSPPARKKNSPLPSRSIYKNSDDTKKEHNSTLEWSVLHPDYLLDPPRPPQRRNSPKTVNGENDSGDFSSCETINISSSTDSYESCSSALKSGNLIDF